MARLNKYTQEVRLALAYAREEAARLRHRQVGPEHLLMGLLRLNDPLIEGLLVSLHTSPTSIMQALDFVVGRGKRAYVSEPVLDVASRAILVHAEEEARAVQAEFIGIEHVLLGFFAANDGLAMGVLESFGIYPDQACQQLRSLMKDGYDHLITSIKYQALYDATPHLNQVSRDLSLEALNGALDPLIGREDELERVLQILARRSKNNPVLLGPAGVGKTALAEGLALRIISGQVPAAFVSYRIVSLDISLIIAGTRFRGDFEDRLKNLMREIVAQSRLIIVIDELHTLIETGVAEGSLNVANLFKPLLARGTLRCIGATTLNDYRRTIETDSALERRFQPVLINETTPAATIAILRGLRERYEAYHRVSVSDEAIQAAVHLSTRYIQGRCQPDSALDLLDEAAACASVRRSLAPDAVLKLREETRAVRHQKENAVAARDFSTAARLLRQERRLRHALWQTEHAWHESERDLRPQIGEAEIAAIVTCRTGVPVEQLSGEEKTRLLSLEQQLHSHVIGQSEAVRAVACAVRRSRARLRNGRHPVGSFLFVGPTGVGKTELARALAQVLFADESALVKLDMSEFTEYHYVARLIGSPPGYVGYEQAGQLTEAVRRRPYCVVLFDEIEKAHPKVLDLLLQILEDGCLSDARGTRVDFRNTIIILTSNIGTVGTSSQGMSFVKMQGEEIQEQLRARTITTVRASLRPELFNRLDEIVVFQPLTKACLRAILDLLIARTRQRLLARSIVLEVSEAVCQKLVECGYSPEHGARHLRRTVQSLLDDLLAEAILRGEIVDGSSVSVDVVHDKLEVLVLASPSDEDVA